MRALRRLDLGPTDVFADVGAGKGVAVLLAGELAVRRAIGVELSPDLAATARRNVELNRRRLKAERIEIVTSDVLQWEIPDDLTVVFLYNPFGGQVFSAVVRALIESYDRAPRRVRIIYRNPAEEAALLATGRVVPIRTVVEFQLTLNLQRWRSLRMYELRPAAPRAPWPEHCVRLPLEIDR